MKKIALVALIAFTLPYYTSRGDIVINEVYGSGGNVGAAFNQDFVELFNNGAVGTAALDLGGFTLQYKPATLAGTFSTFATVPTGTFLGPGESYVIGTGTVGINGAALPANQTNGTAALSATSGAVRVFDISLTQLDLVGYGSATNNSFEGTAPAAYPSNNLNSIQRIFGADTNNNVTDFTAMAASPMPVPEPSSYAMMGLGAALLVGIQRFRRKSS